jgi:hypothetical protein
LWALRPELVDLSRLPVDPIEGRLFASGEDARRSSRREGEEIVRSQVSTLKALSDHLLHEAEAQPQGEWFPFEETEAIWQQVAAQKEEWISSHPAEGFGEYVRARRELFPLPV